MASDQEDFIWLINNNLRIIDETIAQSTDKQVSILYRRLKRMTETEIAKDLDISQGAVNQRAKSGGWWFIKRTLDVLEKVDFDKYVD